MCKPSGVQLGPQEFPESRLVNGQPPGVQLVDLPGVDVNAEYLEPQAGHARGLSDAEITSAQHGQP